MTTQTAWKSGGEAFTERKCAAFVEEVRKQAGEEAARFAYCIAYRQVTMRGLGKNFTPAIESVIREVARKCQFSLS